MNMANDMAGDVTATDNNVTDDSFDADFDNIYNNYAGDEDDKQTDASEGSEKDLMQADGEEEPETVIEEEEGKQPAEQKQDDYPKSWKKEMKEAFDKADPALRDYILEREKQVNDGFAQMDDDRRLGKEYQNVMKPYIEQLEAIGDIGGMNTIKSAMSAVNILNSGSVDQKLDVILSTAKNHGLLPFINHIFSGDKNLTPTEQQFYAMQKENMDLKNYVNHINMRHEAQETHSVEQMVSDFVSDTKNYPHAEKVMGQMMQILEGGLAESLQDAYQKAIYLNEDVRSEIIAQESQKTFQTKTNKAHQAREKSISPKNGGKTIVRHGEEDDLDQGLEAILGQYYSR